MITELIKSSIESIKRIQKVVREYPDGIIDTVSNGRIGRYCFFPHEIEMHYKKRKQQLPNPLVVLDIGCGAAADHPLLFDYYDKKGIELILIGIDINETMLELTRKGLVTYPLEVDLEIDKEGRISIQEDMSSFRNRHKAYFPITLYDYFIKWEQGMKPVQEGIEPVQEGIEPVQEGMESVQGTNSHSQDHFHSQDCVHSQEYFHIDNIINTASGRWIMKPEYRQRLDLRCADAVQLPFEDNFADVIIAENFLFGGQQGVHKRITAEIDRVLKTGGAYLRDRRFIIENPEMAMLLMYGQQIGKYEDQY